MLVPPPARRECAQLPPHLCCVMDPFTSAYLHVTCGRRRVERSNGRISPCPGKTRQSTSVRIVGLREDGTRCVLVGEVDDRVAQMIVPPIVEEHTCTEYPPDPDACSPCC